MLEVEKEGKYISERVINIKELEDYIENAHLSILSLIQGIEEGALVSNQDITKHLKAIDEVLEKAYNFEFCVERRFTVWH